MSRRRLTAELIVGLGEAEVGPEIGKRVAEVVRKHALAILEWNPAPAQPPASLLISSKMATQCRRKGGAHARTEVSGWDREAGAIWPTGFARNWTL